MNLDSFTGPGSTPSRRRFWDKITEAVIASQKIAGKNVTVSEHPGYGTIINVDRGEGGGACCDEDGNCTTSTERQCAGTFQGVGTVCDPNPCGETGACCNEGVCTQTTEGDCAGIFKGVGTPCDPNPCCSDCGGVVWQGCFDGENCRTGPETCDGCAGEIVPCDIAINGLWYTDVEYCLSCPGGELEECCRTSVNPITCEIISTCGGDPDPCICDGPGQAGSTHEMQDYFPPCPELSPPP